MSGLPGGAGGGAVPAGESCGVWLAGWRRWWCDAGRESIGAQCFGTSDQLRHDNARSCAPGCAATWFTAAACSGHRVEGRSLAGDVRYGSGSSACRLLGHRVAGRSLGQGTFGTAPAPAPPAAGPVGWRAVRSAGDVRYGSGPDRWRQARFPRARPLLLRRCSIQPTSALLQDRLLVR